MQTEERRYAVLPRVPVAASIFVGAIGVVTLLGWITGAHVLTELVPDQPRMVATAAIALILLSGSLWLVRDRRGCSDEARAWSRFLAQLAALIGLLTLAEYIFNVDLGIDGLFEDNSGGLYPGRMAPHVAVALVCCGLWLALIDRREQRWAPVVLTLVAISGLVIIAALVGWAYGADYVYGEPDTVGVSPQTIIALAALFIGILAARPDSPWMRLLLSDSAGGHTMRRLVPAVIVIPVVAGAIHVIGVEEGLWTTPVGAAFVVAGGITIILSILIITSRELERGDVERRGLEARLVELADRDPLTNVFNRRRLDDELHLAFEGREDSRTAVLSIDLDGFKAINDTYGHAAGDELLLATADVLRSELRSTDIVARFGGDEFIVLLHDADDEMARIVAGKLIRSFRGVMRQIPGRGLIELRASIGIAVSNGWSWDDPYELIKAADRALYAAKAAGGDRFSVEETLVLD